MLMEVPDETMTRSSSSAASDRAGGTRRDDMAMDTSDRVSASTPPTSYGDSGSVASDIKAGKLAKLEDEDEEAVQPAATTSRRSRRSVRSTVSTYNLKKLSDAQHAEQAATASSSRNVSGLTGRTLVHGDEQVDEEKAGMLFGMKVEKVLDVDQVDSDSDSDRGRLVPRRSLSSAARQPRRAGLTDKVKKGLGRVGSVLGKRGRDAMEAGKRAVGMGAERTDEQEIAVKQKKKNRLLEELDTGVKGLLDEMDLDVELDLPASARSSKKVKTSSDKASSKATVQASASSSAAPVPKDPTAGKRMKKWQKEGLFVGQDADCGLTQMGAPRKLQKKRPGSSASNTATEISNIVPTKRSFMPLPMFAYLDKTRDFTVPFDVFAPSWKKGDEKPKDWHQVNRNRLVGEAKDLWEKSERLPASMCVCPLPGPHEQGCDEQCLNRVMQYECNDDNCNLSVNHCRNRAFQELAARMKKGGAYDVGVEVLKTPDRGFGVRSCRTFAPGQIIMEYTGEIISEGECQRRMREDYKDKQCYYLMELERGLIIDGTKGSMARFINHSCEPNCEVRMMKVNGIPRMGVFAGEDGVVTGEELTYDYNFDNFGTSQQRCYCGAPTCRGFLSKRLNATEQKKLMREESERKRKAVQEAQSHADEEIRKKKAKTERGSSWRGWVSVDDPEIKERLKAEKRAKEAASRNTWRAQRMAARRGSLPAAAVKQEAPMVKRKDSKRTKTTTSLAREETLTATDAPAAIDNVASQEEAMPTTAALSPEKAAVQRRPLHARTTSTGSKFTEDLARPTTGYSTSTIHTKTELAITREEQPAGTAVAGAEAHDEETIEVEPHRASKTMKGALKVVGQAVVSGLKRAGSSAGNNGNGRLKQSTLSFARIS